MNSKQKGNAGIGSAIAYFTKQGNNVLIPLTDSQDYDLVVDIESLLHKVQVKYTTQRAPSGFYIVPLRSISGTSKQVYKTVVETDIDYLFIVTESNIEVLIPMLDITNKNTITLNKDILDKYKVN